MLAEVAGRFGLSGTVEACRRHSSGSWRSNHEDGPSFRQRRQLTLHVTHAVPVDEQRVDVLVPGELPDLIQRDAVLLSDLDGTGDRGVTQSMRPDLDAGLLAQF